MAGGLGQVRTTLKDLRNELTSVKNELAGLEPGSAAFVAAAQRAGELKDQLNEINESVNQFAAGSKFEQFGNVLGGVGDKLKNLDFAGAAEDARKLAAIKFNFADGIKALKDLGSAFASLGKALLTNPLFLIVAVIVAIIVAMVKLRDKVKWIADIFAFLGKILDAIIGFFTDMTDAMGITSVAAEAKAKAIIEGAKAEQEALKKRYEEEIILASAAGKATQQLEIDKREAILKTNDAIIAGYKTIEAEGTILDDEQKKDLEERVEANRKAAVEILAINIKLNKDIATATEQANDKLRLAELNSMEDGLNKQTALINNTFAEQYQKRRAHYQQLLDAAKGNAEQIAQIQKAEATEAVADGMARQAALDKAAADAAKSANDKAKAYANDRLSAQRSIRDLEIAAMKEGFEKDRAETEESYKRKLEDIKRNEKLTAAEKKTLTLLNEAALNAALDQLDINHKKDVEARELQHQNNIRKIKEDAEQKKMEDLRKFQQLQFQLYATDIEKQKAAIDEKANAQIAALETAKQEYPQREAEIQQTILDVQKKAAEEKGAIDDKVAADSAAKRMAEMQATVQQIQQFASLATSAITNILNAVQADRDASREREAQAMEGANTQELNALTEKYNQGLISEEEYNKGKDGLDKKLKQQQIAAARKAFEADKKMKIAQAAIAGLQGGLQAFAGAMSLGPIAGPIVGGVLAGIVAASTLKTISNIKKSSYDSGADAVAPIDGAGIAAEAASAADTAMSPTLFSSNTNGNGNNQSASTERQMQQPRVNVVLVSQEITDQQTRDRYAENIGTL